MTNTIAPLTVEHWEHKFYREHINGHWFRPYMGKDQNAMIHVNMDLSKNPGDAITFPLITKTTGTGKRGSDKLKGSEKTLPQSAFKIKIDQYREAILLKEWEMKKSAIDQMKAVQGNLKNYVTEFDRNKIIDALNSTGTDATGKSLYINKSAGDGSVGTFSVEATTAQKNTWLTNNADRVLFGRTKSNAVAGDHDASLLAIDGNDTLNPKSLALMKRMAEATSPRIRPLKPRGEAKGSDYYVAWMNSLALRDLEENEEFMKANREARNRGKQNPIFSAADYCYKNIAIILVEDIPVFEGVGAGGEDVSPVFLCGSQAIAYAVGLKPKAIKDVEDYGELQGRGIKQQLEIAKMQFSVDGEGTNAVDHGVVTGYFATPADE